MAAYETPNSGMSDEDSMSTMEHSDSGEMHEHDEESMSIFIPKAFMMGTKFKAGDVMEVKIVDIDPETGDAEAKYNTGNGESEDHEYGEGPSMRGFDEAMDKSMPEKE